MSAQQPNKDGKFPTTEWTPSKRIASSRLAPVVV